MPSFLSLDSHVPCLLQEPCFIFDRIAVGNIVCLVWRSLSPVESVLSGELPWKGLKPVSVEWVWGAAQWEWSTLGGGGAHPLHLRQTQPRDRLRTGHEWNRRANLLHVCHRPQQSVERSVTPELSVFHHVSGSECNHCVVLPHCSEHAEADTFFCFTNLMSENRDNFIKSLDDSQCGITYKMESVYSMLKDKDLELYLKLVRSMLRAHCLICLCPNSLLPAVH